MFKKYLDYLRDNPEHYWFKRKLYGWGWVPVSWKGWLIIVIAIAIILAGAHISKIDDAPSAAVMAIIFAMILIFTFCYWKGEKPRWQWGLDKKDK